MKKNYLRPTMRVVIIKQRSHILVGSETYIVTKYNDGGTETLVDENGWDQE